MLATYQKWTHKQIEKSESSCEILNVMWNLLHWNVILGNWVSHVNKTLFSLSLFRFIAILVSDSMKTKRNTIFSSDNLFILNEIFIKFITYDSVDDIRYVQFATMAKYKCRQIYRKYHNCPKIGKKNCICKWISVAKKSHIMRKSETRSRQNINDDYVMLNVWRRSFNAIAS